MNHFAVVSVDSTVSHSKSSAQQRRGSNAVSTCSVTTWDFYAGSAEADRNRAHTHTHTCQLIGSEMSSVVPFSRLFWGRVPLLQ